MALKPLTNLPKTSLTLRRALLSVSDKTNIVPLATSLVNAGVELLSTGGTFKTISEAGIPVKEVSEVTHFPECLDGRVKTLHPKIHGGILARTSHQPDVDALVELDIQAIELVVVNLYPFSQTVAKEGVSIAEATEYIDIGGPTMVRAAAKNFAHVCILSSPSQYDDFQNELDVSKAISYATRLQLAKAAFKHTAEYEDSINSYFQSLDHTDHSDKGEPKDLSTFTLTLPLKDELRYGENPHQNARVYGHQNEFIDCFHGKALSYNNYLDIDSALRLYQDFIDDQPTCGIFKHTIPCGVASAQNLNDAYKKAFSTDTVSPFGGIVIVNKSLDIETAQSIDEIFTEIILAPDFSQEALDLLTQKKNRRLIKINSGSHKNSRQFRSIFGGLLEQDEDNAPINSSDFEVVSNRKPSTEEWNDMLFGWRIVRHVKSNAIVFAKNQQTLGIGSGQTSRVDSSEIAVFKAKKEQLSLEGSAIASDAFFPFSDGVEAAAKAGATAVIQPGGSVRDQEVIQKANELGLTMVFTSKRHFRH